MLPKLDIKHLTNTSMINKYKLFKKDRGLSPQIMQENWLTYCFMKKTKLFMRNNNN